MLGRQTWRESCQPSGEEVEKEMINSNWDEKESSLFVTTTISKSHQGNHQERFSFWFTKPERSVRGEKTNTTNQPPKSFWYFKAREAFSSAPHANWKTAAKQKSALYYSTWKKGGGTMARRHLENFYTHFLQRRPLRIIKNAFAAPKNNHFWLCIILTILLLGVVFFPNQIAA